MCRSGKRVRRRDFASDRSKVRMQRAIVADIGRYHSALGLLRQVRRWHLTLPREIDARAMGAFSSCCEDAWTKVRLNICAARTIDGLFSHIDAAAVPEYQNPVMWVKAARGDRSEEKKLAAASRRWRDMLAISDEILGWWIDMYGVIFRFCGRATEGGNAALMNEGELQGHMRSPKSLMPC